VDRNGGIKLGDQDITQGQWAQRAFVMGEVYDIYTVAGRTNVAWSPDYTSFVNQPVTWFSANFTTPRLPQTGVFSVLLDISGLNRGHAYVNGYDIAHYWIVQGSGTNRPTQSVYQIPTDWLMHNGTQNLLTIFEEVGATDPNSVQIVISQMAPTDSDTQSQHVVSHSHRHQKKQSS